MKIALIGFGKMGREVESVLAETPHKIVSVSLSDDKKLDIKGIKQADVAIDFTSPEIIMNNISQVLTLGTNMVVGTTGWYGKIEEVEKIVKKTKTGLIYGSNFSIGANIFFQIVSYASKLFGKFSDYDVAGLETHHTGKKDSPSGTAKKITDILIKNMPKKKRLETGSLQRAISSEELHFVSLRSGRYFGRHDIYFDSPSDEIKMSHEAHNRLGFAKGAVYAAEFVNGKKGLYSFEDVFIKSLGK